MLFWFRCGHREAVFFQSQSSKADVSLIFWRQLLLNYLVKFCNQVKLVGWKHTFMDGWWKVHMTLNQSEAIWNNLKQSEAILGDLK